MEGVKRAHSRGGLACYDLIVIGGGPAGTAAAITAARRGASVLLLERGRLPRHRVCGEFVSAESLELLSSLLAGASPRLLEGAPRIRTARLFCEGRTISSPVDPPAASVARFDLDAALWEAAREAGVDARLPLAAECILGRGPFRVPTAARDWQARAVIQASGRWSNLRREPTAGDPGNRSLGLKAHFAETCPPTSVDLYFFEGGYCGVQPVRLAGSNGPGRINVCAMVRAQVACTLEAVFARHPQLAARARGWQPQMEPVSTAPLLFWPLRPVEDSVLLAGDAAGFVDPFVGGGISLALRSGVLAAECLVTFWRGETALRDAALCYREQYQRHLFPVFRHSAWIRRLLELPRPLRSSIARLLEAAPAITQYMASQTR